MIVWSLVACLPFAFALPSVGLAGAIALLVAIGLVMDANFYPLVVVAQDALPRYVGFASGVVLGLSIGLGAGAAWLLGILADHAGLPAALYACGGLAAAAWAISLALPPERARSRALLRVGASASPGSAGDTGQALPASLARAGQPAASEEPS